MVAVRPIPDPVVPPPITQLRWKDPEGFSPTIRLKESEIRKVAEPKLKRKRPSSACGSAKRKVRGSTEVRPQALQTSISKA